VARILRTDIVRQHCMLVPAHAAATVPVRSTHSGCVDERPSPATQPLTHGRLVLAMAPRMPATPSTELPMVQRITSALPRRHLPKSPPSKHRPWQEGTEDPQAHAEESRKHSPETAEKPAKKAPDKAAKTPKKSPVRGHSPEKSHEAPKSTKKLSNDAASHH
jgi:hypothetical protein